jgi:hypothetical protein
VETGAPKPTSATLSPPPARITDRGGPKPFDHTHLAPSGIYCLDTPTLTADRISSTWRTIWVEPYTGAFIKGSQQVDQRLVAEEGQAPVINGYMEYAPDTVRRNVDEYASAAQGLRFVSCIGPLGGWIL